MITIKGTNYYTLHELAESRKLNLTPGKTKWANWYAIKKEIEAGNLEVEHTNFGKVKYLISEEAIKKFKQEVGKNNVTA